MPTNDEVSSRIAAVGGLIDDVETIVRSGEAAWTVRFGHTDVEIEFEAASGTVHLLSLVGFVARERLPDVHQALLQFNHLQRETRVCMSLTAEGEVAQSAAVRLNDPSPRDLAHLLRNFADKIQVWRSFISEDAPRHPPFDGDETLLLKI